MSDDGGPRLYGELAVWPTKEEMASLLHAAGLQVVVGRYSIRVKDFSHFAFQEYGGDLGNPTIEADADSPEELRANAQQLSKILAKAGLVHRFEVYDVGDELVGYFHYRWPQG